ncbi:MAG: hypothetical protein KA125_14100, partial [Chromatiaceae bacterium]|nr:hypothetical protein [Chromatiaceae bacterium]
GCHLAGWVANQVDPGLARREENLATLSSLIRALSIGFIPWLGQSAGGGEPETLASHLAIGKIWP